jgi:V8-like Glu-specific endopeptidase
MRTARDSPFLDAETGFGEADDEAFAPWRTLRPDSPYVQGEIEARETLVEEEKGEIDGDDRRQVADPLAVPFRWICSIAVARRITRASGGTSRTGLAPAGSGVLISPRHVLTAAHLLLGVTRDSSGGVAERHEAQTVRVKFGRSGNDALVEVEAERWDWPRRQWRPESGGSAYDFALITLKQPVGAQVFKALKNQALGHWGGAAGTSLDRLPAALASRLLRTRVFTAGYPDSSKGRMVCSAGVLSTGSAAHDRALSTPALVEQWARQSTLFSMTADTTEGQSGSPVWVVDQGTRFIVGVAVSAGDTFNQVRGIDPFLLRCLDGWMGTVGTRREVSEHEAADSWREPADRWMALREAPHRDGAPRSRGERARAPEADRGHDERGNFEPDFGNDAGADFESDSGHQAEGDFEVDDEQLSSGRRGDDETHDREDVDDPSSGDSAAHESHGSHESDESNWSHRSDWSHETHDGADHERDAPDPGDTAPLFEAEDGVFEHDKSEVDRLLDARDWPGALQAAIAAGEHDESKLTNLLFFARHTDLDPTRPLNPKTSKADAKLASEWSAIHKDEVWPQIVAAAKNLVLAVHGEQIASRLVHFRGSAGRRFKQLVETAAQQVGLNPGLLAAALIGETGTIADYLSASKVGSYRTGVDDFYAMRGVLAQTVPAYSRIRWDRKQKPAVHLNDAQTNPREVQSIWFDSGPDALLATAVYLKYGEVRLRADAVKLGGDFDALPVETRFALIRMSMAAGRAGAATRLAKALKGLDILVRDWTPPKIYQTNRNATIRAAEAMFLSGWVFGQPLPATPRKQPEQEWFEAGGAAMPDDFEPGEDENHDARLAAASRDAKSSYGEAGEDLFAGDVFERGTFERFESGDSESGDAESGNAEFEDAGFESGEFGDGEFAEGESGVGESGEDETPDDEARASPAFSDDREVGLAEGFVDIEHDQPSVATREVVVGERIEIDLATTAFAGQIKTVQWDIPGRVVRGYDGTVNNAMLIELTDTDRTRSRIVFFWVDGGDGRTVRATIRTTSGTTAQHAVVFDVKQPVVETFGAKLGKTRIEKRAGLTGMRFGTLVEAPGIKWSWKVTMPKRHAGHIKDVQTVRLDRTQVLRLQKGGSKTRTLVRRHPRKPAPHLQLDGHDAGQAIYTSGLSEPLIEAGKSFTNNDTSDSPHTGLTPLGTTVSVDDRFTYFLMFKPDTAKASDAIWVPVAKATWGWKATAKQRGGRWLLSPTAVKPVLEKKTTEFPLYDTNVEENEWQEVAPPVTAPGRTP